MRAYNEYGELYHLDTPSWPDDREDALDKLVHAQGFDFQVVAGDFSDEAVEDGEDLYWQEMRAWNPKAPAGDWRLAWKGDTEDGPYAWFVRPMALRPDPEAIAPHQPAQGGTLIGWRMIDGVRVYEVASHSGIVDPQKFVLHDDYLAAQQPVGQEPVVVEAVATIKRDADGDHYLDWLLEGGIAEMSDGDVLMVCNRQITNEEGVGEVYTAPPAPAAVPVEVVRDAERYRWLREQSGADISIEEADEDGDMVFVSGHSAEELDEAVDKALQLDRMVSKAHDRFEAAMLATHPQPPAACEEARPMDTTPAQVELRQFRPFVQSERDYLSGRIERCDAIGSADRLQALQVKYRECDRLLALIDSAHVQAPAAVTMADALAAGDETLHGAVDSWQERALRAERQIAQTHDTRRMCVDELLAELNTPPAVAAVPIGYSLVPTSKLKQSASVLERDGDEHGIGLDIRAMLAAHPQPAAAKDGDA
ncbi:hypothetical protein EBN15_14575 [Xanthomonas cucurbitae]|nr:hypothetical protein EBN15_14575 [Xanthomonas cucurbitae]